MALWRFCVPGASTTSSTSACGNVLSRRSKCGCARTAAIGSPSPGGRTRNYWEGGGGKEGPPCKEIGAIALWNKNKSEDEVFKIYRREYKKRFAWIKAKRIDPAVFYEWSAKTREKKKTPVSEGTYPEGVPGVAEAVMRNAEPELTQTVSPGLY